MEKYIVCRVVQNEPVLHYLYAESLKDAVKRYFAMNSEDERSFSDEVFEVAMEDVSCGHGYAEWADFDGENFLVVPLSCIYRAL